MFYVNIVSLVGRTTRFPSPLEVNWVVYNLDVSIYAKPELFPSPYEVDRFLYELVVNPSTTVDEERFRPLSRQIGSYTG